VDPEDVDVNSPDWERRGKAELRRVLARRYEIGLAMIDDPSLVDQPALPSSLTRTADPEA
jgi:hypothetical protein